MSARILFVEDEAPFRSFASTFLERHGFAVDQVGTAAAALERVSEDRPDLVLLDLNLPDLHGLEVLRRLIQADGAQRVVILTSLGDAANAVKAMKAGATDYLTKPIELTDLLEGVRQGLEASGPAVGPASGSPPGPAADPAEVGAGWGLTGAHPSWLACLERLEQAAKNQLETLLLLGESGTGKSELARRFHRISRGAGPFVEVDCPSIPEALLESELFGHERGAFTGALKRKRGQVELAHEGTLFLDEVGELPLALQPKLLRFLEQRRFRRVGGEKEQACDVQVVCATNRDLVREVEAGTFRRDLYYRLEVVSVQLPPLRERGEDALRLARGFLASFAQRRGRAAPRLSEAAQRALREHPFPGNARELRNVIQRALAFHEGDVLEPRHLDLQPFSPVEEAGPSGALEDVELEPYLRALEAHYIQLALFVSASQREAAELLGMDRYSLARRCRQRKSLGSPDEVRLRLEDAPEWLRRIVGELPEALPETPLDLPEAIARWEHQAVVQAVRALGGNRTRAAGLLGMSRATLSRRLES